MQAIEPYWSFIGYDHAGCDVIASLRKFRKQLFYDELGWELHVDGDEERDDFDQDCVLHCALLQGNRVVGGFRATPTCFPYLSHEVFARLATLRPFPHRSDIYEVSRLGVLGDGEERLRRAMMVYGLMMHVARTRSAVSLVAVADLTYERFLRRIGIATRRYGPPQAIGFDRHGRELRAVAGEIPMLDQPAETLDRLSAAIAHLEIDDAASVFGRQRLSA